METLDHPPCPRINYIPASRFAQAGDTAGTRKYIMNQGAFNNPVMEEVALTLLKNRLRIFLSRGIKGTYVFCEDDETGEFLMNAYENNIPV